MKVKAKRDNRESTGVKRREFLKAGAAVACAAMAPTDALAAEKKSKVVVVHGTDLAKMVEVGMAKMGGWAKFVKPDSKVAIKPNLAWNSKPEQGGNIHPDILRAVVLAVEACKPKQIVIPENSCHPEKMTFRTSGAIKALEGTSAKLYRPKKPTDYKEVDVPKGKVCKKAKVTRDLLEADCLINMPIAKHHVCTELTLSMKNWMGAIDNGTRRTWHRRGLHQCIADLSTFLKPTLIIMDATRIMLDHGPQGPGKLAHPNEIIFSTDPVALDTYTATLFGKKPADVQYIHIAAEMGVGCDDIAKIDVERVEV